VVHSSWYQVPVLYGWWDLTAGGALITPAAPNGHGGNGAGNGSSSHHPVEGESA